MKDDKNSVQDENEPKIDKNDDKVAYETYSRVLGEKKKTATENKSLKERIANMELEQEESHKAKLNEDNKYKELNEILAKENEDLKEGMSSQQKKIIDSYKLQAFKESLPGKILNDQYLSFINLKDIIIEDGNKVNNESVKVAVDKFMNEHSSLIKMNEQELPNDAPRNIKNTGITADEYKKLPLVEQKKRYQEFRSAEKAREAQA